MYAYSYVTFEACDSCFKYFNSMAFAWNYGLVTTAKELANNMDPFKEIRMAEN